MDQVAKAIGGEAFLESCRSNIGLHISVLFDHISYFEIYKLLKSLPRGFGVLGFWGFGGTGQNGDCPVSV